MKHEFITLLSVSRQEAVTTLNFERESESDISYSPNDILLVTKEDVILIINLKWIIIAVLISRASRN